MAQQTFDSGDTAPVVRNKLNQNAADVAAHHETQTNPHGTTLTQAHLAVVQTVSVPDGFFVRSLRKSGEPAGITDHVTLSEGDGIDLTQVGQDITLVNTGISNVCLIPKLVISGVYGDGYLSIPCTDYRTAANFRPVTGAAGFLICAQAAHTGTSSGSHEYLHPQDHSGEGEPYDSFPMIWYDIENGPVYENGLWRLIVQYRNVNNYLAFWCRAERIGPE